MIIVGVKSETVEIRYFTKTKNKKQSLINMLLTVDTLRLCTTM